jgi:dephospho-CoA kinase/formamidopyrimidine-DNA glycosylase
MTRVIGLTGGIASGKSTISRYLLTKGAVILDADAIARDLSQPEGMIYNAYVEHFGRGILRPDGELDRRAIGQLVFNSTAEKEWIDTVTHPLIRDEMQLRLQQKKEQGSAIILLDVPLLFESGWDKMAEGTCLVYVDESVQLARLMARNSYGREEALARIHAQMPLSEKKKRARWLIDNNGDRSAALEQADRLWKEWTHEGLS